VARVVIWEALRERSPLEVPSTNAVARVVIWEALRERSSLEVA
jgi:hypothetical protein